MLPRGFLLLCLCLLGMQQPQEANSQRIDPEVRAQLEHKVIASMSLKELEEMVENDERVLNAPKPRIVIVPKPKDGEGLLDDDREAIVIHRKQKKFFKKAGSQPEYRFSGVDFDESIRRSSYDPDFGFERRSFSYENDFPSFFGVADLESAGSSPVKNFYESLVESVLHGQKLGIARDPLAALEMAASEDVPSYKPRFDYDAYSKDSTETKLQGKSYWRDAPERREETVDENGCRTVVKKIMDPEDEKKASSDNAKSVIITKECEYPTLSGPDAKIPGAQPIKFETTSRFDSSKPSKREEPSSYEDSRAEELDFKKPEAKDPLAPDYIDKMLSSHFRNFPSFSNPITSFRGYQERFKLQTPEAFKSINPTVGVHTYEYTHPQSGFEDKSDAASGESYSDKEFESPRDSYRDERQFEAPRDSYKYGRPQFYGHQHRFEQPENREKKQDKEEYDDKKDLKKGKDGKEPKMVKKSFAYYRKDNPKEDPNDHQYAEEYAQGNYRSFSSSYDSEKDGPKKQ